MRDGVKAYLSLATGLTEVPRQRALAAAKAFVAQGEATAEQVSSLTEDLVAQTRANGEAVTALVKYEVDRTLGRVGLASNEEVGSLTARVQALEAELRAIKTGLTRSDIPSPPATPAKAAPDKATPIKAAKAAKPAKVSRAVRTAAPARSAGVAAPTPLAPSAVAPTPDPSAPAVPARPAAVPPTVSDGPAKTGTSGPTP